MAHATHITKKDEKAAERISKDIDEARKLISKAKDEAGQHPSASPDAGRLRERLDRLYIGLCGASDEAHDWKNEHL